jgi:hypothetical protein
VGDIDTAAVDSLKTLDPKRPIREATEKRTQFYVGSVPQPDSCGAAKHLIYSITSSARASSFGD